MSSIGGSSTDLIFRPGEKIGLLGGSFNPAHKGHVHISKLALSKLGLDRVLWLVSPQNPLKPSAGMALLEKRVAEAKKVANGRQIDVTDIELELGSRYTADTLQSIKSLFPKVHFVWIMGADNLVQMHHWYEWRKIFRTMPVAVFARPAYSGRALNAKVARRFSRFRLPGRRARSLVTRPAPAWTFLDTVLDGTSATRIRASLKFKQTHINKNIE